MAILGLALLANAAYRALPCLDGFPSQCFVLVRSFYLSGTSAAVAVGAYFLTSVMVLVIALYPRKDSQ